MYGETNFAGWYFDDRLGMSHSNPLEKYGFVCILVLQSSFDKLGEGSLSGLLHDRQKMIPPVVDSRLSLVIIEEVQSSIEDSRGEHKHYLRTVFRKSAQHP